VENFPVATMEVGAVQSIIKMVKSQHDDVRECAAYVLNRMVDA
jgi:hypothetical protein